jgi:hypothetical protein
LKAPLGFRKRARHSQDVFDTPYPRFVSNPIEEARWDLASLIAVSEFAAYIRWVDAPTRHFRARQIFDSELATTESPQELRALLDEVRNAGAERYLAQFFPIDFDREGVHGRTETPHR